MKAEYVNVINMLYDQSKKAYVDCDRGNLFWGDDGDDVFFTLEILSSALAGSVTFANRKNTLLIDDIKDSEIAGLEEGSIFSYSEIVEWIARYGRETDSYNSMIYLLSLESLRTALIIFLKQIDVDTSNTKA